MFTEDLTPFFSTADFAVSAVFKGRTFAVIFDNDHAEMFGMAGSSPSATCRSVDVADALPGEAITVDGELYTIKGPPEPDSTGITVLRLNET